MKSVYKSIIALGLAIICLSLMPGKARPGENQIDKRKATGLLAGLPEDLELEENSPQKYVLTTSWYNRDVRGDATAKFIIRGEYTRGLGGGKVRWNNVMIEVFENPEGAGSDTLAQDWMEGFSYRSPEDIASQELFASFPANETTHLLRTLVWDAIAFETFAWNYFDILELNKTISPADMEEFSVRMADWGTIQMKNLKLTWTGISKNNGELCALIQYESFVNPVLSFGVTGRSLYWGRVWVSLEDKEIEYATLNEDVNMEMTTPGKGERFLNIQREVTFARID